MEKRNEIESGWAIEPRLGVYHFEHVSTEFANEHVAKENEVYVVETINWTLADEEGKFVHLNKYFAFGINDALAIAVEIQLASSSVAEEFLGIRIATQEEYDMFTNVYESFDSQMPKAISDDEAKLLPEV
jgi:hypothetical protein